MGHAGAEGFAPSANQAIELDRPIVMVDSDMTELQIMSAVLNAHLEYRIPPTLPAFTLADVRQAGGRATPDELGQMASELTALRQLAEAAKVDQSKFMLGAFAAYAA